MIEINQTLIDNVQEIAKEAGEAILEVYNSDDFSIEQKDDNSPLTRADKAANDVIIAGLKRLGNTPIVSEENTIRNVDDEFWLVDPLDGTKEFIKRNGEFTVNIALVRGKRPVFGVVYVPVTRVFYIGDAEHGYAVKYSGSQEESISAVHDHQPPVIVVSRSHRDERTEALLTEIGEHEAKSMGSSLKLCLVAEGAALLYPRLAPTSLWDTAAADAVVTAAGGAVKQLNGELLRYDPSAEILNPYFVVEAKNNAVDWQKALA